VNNQQTFVTNKSSGSEEQQDELGVSVEVCGIQYRSENTAQPIRREDHVLLLDAG
jgi:hypothetical protein